MFVVSPSPVILDARKFFRLTICIIIYVSLGIVSAHVLGVFFLGLSAICRPNQIPINMDCFPIYMQDTRLIRQSTATPTTSASCSRLLLPTTFALCASVCPGLCICVSLWLILFQLAVTNWRLRHWFQFLCVFLGLSLVGMAFGQLCGIGTCWVGTNNTEPDRQTARQAGRRTEGHTDRTWAFLFGSRCLYCYSLLQQRSKEKFVCQPESSSKCMSKAPLPACHSPLSNFPKTLIRQR